MQTAPSAPPVAASPTGEKFYRVGTLKYTMRGLILLFAWMLWGDFCFTLMEAVVPSILPLKMHSLHANNSTLGLVMGTIPGVFNLLITPVISFQSDRHRSKFGRRLPFITLTVPFMSLSLVLIAYADDIGRWMNTHAIGVLGETGMIILVLSIFASMFSFFNMFVYTVYWYLFNDVVPQEWMGRFMSWFKLVGWLSSSLYNFFIFKYAEPHMRLIFLCAAGLYFFGFGLMCLRTKEGEYPPPDPAEKRQSTLDKFKTFGRECYTMRFYWDIYLSFAFLAMVASINIFGIFQAYSFGLDNNLVGKMGGVIGIAVSVCLLFAGPLVDKWNAVRVNAYWLAFMAFTSVGGWIWLLIGKPNTMLFFWSSLIAQAVFSVLFLAINSVLELPRVMALFPKERFGTFSGAISLLRAPAAIVGGFLAGGFMDLWKHLFPEGNYYYRYMFLWTAPLTILAFYFHYRVYRAWKRLGGEKDYVAPTKPFRLRDLKPHPGDDGKVLKGPVVVLSIMFGGGILSSLVWWGYYMFFEVNHYYANLFLIGLGTGVIIFLAYLRFLKFMERP